MYKSCIGMYLIQLNFLYIIEKVLERGEKLDILIEKTEDLEASVISQALLFLHFCDFSWFALFFHYSFIHYYFSTVLVKYVS